MIEIQGKYNTAKIFTDVADEKSQELAEMGYLHEEIMWGEDIDMFK